MVKISDLKVGQVFTNEFEGITRDLLKQYAKASGDTNPIHVNDAVAEAAGLKGVSVGDAQISNLHANFFINLGAASAADVHSLIDLARREVEKMFDLELELEIEFVGEWS